MGKSVRPDFNAEETLSVQKDKREIRRIIQEMAEYLPQEDPEKGVYIQFLYIIRFQYYTETRSSSGYLEEYIMVFFNIRCN